MNSPRGLMAKVPNFTIIVDSREQKPLRLEYSPGKIIHSEVGKLYTGDYSIKGLEDHVCIERKSLPDMMMCIGRERERFDKEIQRMRGFDVKALVVESDWMAIERGAYRSKVRPTSAIGSLMGWIAMGIPVVMAGNHKRAGVFVARMLVITANRRLKQLAFLK
jgi:ERCC4-type nuclease